MVFTFGDGWKNSEEDFMTPGNDEKFKCQVSVVELYRNTATPTCLHVVYGPELSSWDSLCCPKSL